MNRYIHYPSGDVDPTPIKLRETHWQKQQRLLIRWVTAAGIWSHGEANSPMHFRQMLHFKPRWLFIRWWVARAARKPLHPHVAQVSPLGPSVRMIPR